MFQVTNVESFYGAKSNLFNLFVENEASTEVVRQFKGTRDSSPKPPGQWMNPYIKRCTIVPNSYYSGIHRRISRIRENPTS